MFKNILIIVAFFAIFIVGYDIYNKKINHNIDAELTNIANKNTIIKDNNTINHSSKVELDINNNTNSSSINNTSKIASPNIAKSVAKNIIKTGDTFCLSTSSTDKNILIKVTDSLDKLGVIDYSLLAQPTNVLYHVIWGISSEQQKATDLVLQMRNIGLFKDKEIKLKKINNIWSLDMAQYNDLKRAEQELDILKTGGANFGGLWFLSKSTSPIYYLDFTTDSAKLENSILTNFKQISWEKSICDNK